MRTEKELCAEQEQPVTTLCRSRGIASNTFYRWKRRFEQKTRRTVANQPFEERF
ncbi:MAG: transposase [Candidatus Heimdallarchaeota archaeon]